MNTMNLRTSTTIGALAASMIACGGNVSLGGNGSRPTGTVEAPQNSEEAAPSPGERVLKRPGFSFYSLIIASDYLYLVGVGSSGSGDNGSYPQGIYRCRKSDCEQTFEQFVSGNISFQQVLDDRMGIMSWLDGSYGFSTVALSNGKDEQIVIQGLPGGSFSQPLFHDGFVFFSIPDDRGIYRCALPTCASSPERLARTSGRNAIVPRAEGDNLLWSEYSFIYRAAGYGTEPVLAFLPDDSLSEVTSSAIAPEDLPGDQVDSIDVGNGRLYASVARSPDGLPCDSYCPHEVVSWPVTGGASQHFFSSDSRLDDVQIFDGELVWLGPSKTSNSADAATVSSCRIEACDTTRRDLGGVMFEHAVVVADDHDVYWIEAEAVPPPDAISSGWFQMNQIRRAPRLPVP